MIDTTAEFTITRRLNAPRDLVWRLWTTEDELVRWHCPTGASIPRETQSFDVRVGGQYRYTMISDETGEEFPTGGNYVEIVAPEKLVFTWGDPKAAEDSRAVITVTLAEDGDATDMTFHLRGFAGQPGDGYVYDGWADVLDKLDAQVNVA